MSDDIVRIPTKLLRQFQAAAQLVLVRNMDSTAGTADSLSCDSTVLNLDFRSDDHCLNLLIRENKRTGDKFSLLMGKKTVLPPPRSECGRWPFDGQEDEDYREFDIGETPEGDPIKSTCDPDALDNYFGINPGAQHYVTPVYFTPEVLDRYYSDPKYEVRDGYLACGGLWGLRLDNNHPDHEMVWLGDLGRDLPEKERHYWLAHNVIVPQGAPSQTESPRVMRRLWRSLGGWSHVRSAEAGEVPGLVYGIRSVFFLIPAEDRTKYHEDDEQCDQLAERAPGDLPSSFQDGPLRSGSRVFALNATLPIRRTVGDTNPLGISRTH
ncbi:hypothetical protein [Candidatus Poriferisocius sp.]|uniref:hypothetical protein n=1 Tax=Candidatus Poriferisocius sp. TaxID=3101276 RepID=UPI003B01DB64